MSIDPTSERATPSVAQSAGFDPTFDFRAEVAAEEDPDATSPTLKAYHKLLWSKPLPSGDPFELDDSTPGAYLHHRSARGDFFLTSDSAVNTWTRWGRMKRVIEPIPESERERFRTSAGQMGGRILFPVGKTDGKPTINVERGRNAKISDRIDLTLECIRLHYLGEVSPMANVLNRYGDFFALFEDFNGYTHFFLLQDLVKEDSLAVEFFLPFADFTTAPLARDADEYQAYMQKAIRFVEARNRRMSEYVGQS
jgi:Family of unknown function (DUF6994)